MAPNKPPRHYAAITHSGKIISNGHASLAGCSKLCRHAVTRHAEMDAIFKVVRSRSNDYNKNRRFFKNSVLWSLRWKVKEETFDNQGTDRFVLGNAKPCILCQRIAIKHGIQTVCYSTEEGTIVRENLADMDCYMTGGSRKAELARFNKRYNNGRDDKQGR